jgi:excisionase family DNA binding protein
MFGHVSPFQKVAQQFAQAHERQQQMEERLDQLWGHKQGYTVLEAAVFWDRHEKTVRRWIREAKISATNKGERKTRISRQQMLDKQWELRRK